ncbi:hypothetical protein [Aquimarina mytili]|uniref:DUF4174 domain-containing protein n=1 Tax=Aquimarina mytili TaxID=874423 RepID=A0A936ZPC2_9FLAO|nr:hypothetical protein [Aquimarina mytili]MBL0683279.1 hypothetical protein [Aquimarina mytili]
MKTLVLILVSLIIGLLSATAQTTTTTTSTSSTKVTVNSNDNDKKYYRSFAIIDMDDSFRVKIKFLESLQKNVKLYLMDQLGKDNMVADSESYLWRKELENEEMYEVQLKENKLRIHVNKELASDKLLKKFKQMGKELKSLTSKKGN